MIDKRFMKLTRSRDGQDLKNSKAIADIDPGDYDVIFMAGGWGAAYDLMQSEELG